MHTKHFTQKRPSANGNAKDKKTDLVEASLLKS